VSEDRNDLTDSTKLLWEQAQRQLAQQNADLDTLRTRAIALLSVSAIVAGLFGSRLSHTHLSTGAAISAILALGLFAINVVLTVWIVTPVKNGWRFTYPLRALITRTEAGTVLPMDVAISLAHYAEQSRKENEDKLASFYGQSRIVCVLAGIQVVAWAVAVMAF
jgi:hypothetical protein